MAWLWLGLTMPYHAYAPLPHWPVTPSPSPSRVSSVTFCVCVCSRKFMQLPGCKQDQEDVEEKEEEDAGLAAWLAFYFILFALITSPATLLKNIFACWEISRSLFHAPGPPCHATAGRARTWHGTQQDLQSCWSSSWQVHTFRSGC